MESLDLWREIGLPGFAIPKRARLRIDRFLEQMVQNRGGSDAKL